MTGKAVMTGDVNARHHIVVMGVAGCGKSTIGAALAERLDAEFLDGDSLHPQANIDKMASGTPLDDDDRAPWLAEIGRRFPASNSALVIACSALKRSYRDIIRSADPSVVFVHLHGTRELLNARMNARPGHFMPASLLDSQLATLEPLQSDEAGVVVNIAQSVEDIVAEVGAALSGLAEVPAGGFSVDLKAAPFKLDDAAVQWVESTISTMTLEEKIGQLFINHNNDYSPGYLDGVLENFHVGGMRYRPGPSAAVQEHIRYAQSKTRIPLLIASNPEMGGAGSCDDGTFVSTHLQAGFPPGQVNRPADGPGCRRRNCCAGL
ncbi:carbohydrate kinase (thermoresistant glucokinase family) [Paenarthrobacter sp. A20]|nr:gluconokinase [Paenarthrobacter sp. A20]MCP1412195.1 carbohydrate kinase (thermoresistant glucokinase family) [Paenarthrobacter sp. A20]